MASKQKYRLPINFPHISFSLLLVFTISTEFATASQDILPRICDSVECPPLSNITCPDDSKIRESIIDLDGLTTAPDELSYNTTQLTEEIYAQCCLSKKCMCKTCYIPDCHGTDEVVVEVLPESMETPGHCCGQYECHREPNCTEVLDTETYWLTDCKRCKCHLGSRICHQSCDTQTAICSYQSLNKYFEHGQTWKDGCLECECVHGEPKCVMSFCKSVNCPVHRQVRLKDRCCPICWPKGARMPSPDDEDTYDGNVEVYDDDDDEPIDHIPPQSDEFTDNEPLPNIQFDSKEFNSTKSEETLASEKSSVTIKTTPAVVIATMTETTPANSTVLETKVIPETPTETTTTTTVAPAILSSTEITATTPNNFIQKENEFVIVTDADDDDDLEEQKEDATDLSASSSINVNNPLDSKDQRSPPCQSDHKQSITTSTTTQPTHREYTAVVEVVPPQNKNLLLYSIIVCLALVVVGLTVWNFQLRAKQRSYRPVEVDDNFNKMSSSNIKKHNDYV